MADALTLKEAVEQRGPYAVWDLLTEDEQRDAATALWENADRDTRALVELTLAKELKFRAQSVRRLSADRVVPRLLRLAEELPENVLFQFLFHLHMASRRPLLVEFLDALGLPHDNGVLDLPEDAQTPAPDAIATAARDLMAAHGHQGLVYLATLRVADSDLWSGVEEILDGYGEDGAPIEPSSKKSKK